MCFPFDMKIRPMTKGKTVMRRFAATPGGAESPLPAIRSRTGRGSVPAARDSQPHRATRTLPLPCVQIPVQSSQSKFQETIIALVGIGIRNSEPSIHTTISLKNCHPSAKVFIAANRAPTESTNAILAPEKMSESAHL